MAKTAKFWLAYVVVMLVLSYCTVKAILGDKPLLYVMVAVASIVLFYRFIASEIKQLGEQHNG